MIDVEQFMAQLIEFDALRDNDEIEVETVERIAPTIRRSMAYPTTPVRP